MSPAGGSGAGGATCAVTLARAGQKVCIVEAGAWRDPRDYPSSTYGAMRDLFDDWGGQVTRGRALWPVVQARTVGGTTVINSASCVRTPADIFNKWKEFGVGGQARADRVWGWQDRLESELSVQEVPPQSLGRSNRLALVGARKLDYEHHVISRYAKDCEGTGQCLQGCKKKKKQSLNITYVPEVLERGGSVLSSATVHKFEFSGRRAVAVRGRMVDPSPLRRERQRGASFFVRARKGVIVAASATHSPALLIRSKVRLPALGHGFRAHPGTGVFGYYDDPVDQNIGATQGWASTAFRKSHDVKLETLSLPPEMVISRLPGGGQVLMLQAGDHFAAGARWVNPCIFGFSSRVLPDQLDTLLEAPLEPRCYVAVLSHLFGGCVMGDDPRGSVVDGRGAVHGYESLWVADASMIPGTLGVNPQHTIMALAGMVAEDIDQAMVKAA